MTDAHGGTLWQHAKIFRADGAEGVCIVSSDNPGTGVRDGALWFDPDSMGTYVYYGGTGQGHWFPITVPLVDDPGYQSMVADQQRFITFTKAQYDEANRRIQLIEKNQDRIDEVWKFLNEGGFDPQALIDIQEQLDKIKQDMVEGDQSVRDDLNNRIDALETELDQYCGKIDEAIKKLEADKLNRVGPDTFKGDLTIEGGKLDMSGNGIIREMRIEMRLTSDL